MIRRKELNLRSIERGASGMKEAYVNSFLAPAKVVWARELGCALNLVKAEAVSHQFTTEEITAIIGISGRLEGTVLYGFQERTGKSIVMKLLREDAGEVNDQMALSALGELANMITGKVTIQLASAGYPCDLSPPVIIEPAGSRFTTMEGVQILVTFDSEIGQLVVGISLQEVHD